MIFNGLSVAASLLKRGEDALLGQTELATAFQLNKRDLVAAREKTGCYSLTRYHLNEAADLLGLKPTDFVYRVSPSLLKADGSSGSTISGAEAGSLGAGGLDDMTQYRADVDVSTDTDAMLLDLAGAAQGGDFAPEDVTNRFKVIKDIAEAQGGSFVAAILSTMGPSTFVRYNASVINKTVFDTLNDPDGALPSSRQAAATLHILLACFGAYSTGAALSMLRQFLSTGIMFRYDEEIAFSTFAKQATRRLCGHAVWIKRGTERPNAKLDKVFDAAYAGTNVWRQSPYFSVSDDTEPSRFATKALQNEMKRFVEEYADSFKATTKVQQLDVEALVTRTNKLLKSTPQLLSRQA